MFDDNRRPKPSQANLRDFSPASSMLPPRRTEPDGGTITPVDWGLFEHLPADERRRLLAGATRQSTNKVLQQAAADSAIALRRGAIEVLDPEALARRAR